MAYLGDPRASRSGSFVAATGTLAPAEVLGESFQRTGLHIYNDTNQTVYVGFCPYTANANGRVNTTTRFTTKIVSQAEWDLDTDKVYYGPVSVIWQTLPSTGSVLITELS